MIEADAVWGFLLCRDRHSIVPRVASTLFAQPVFKRFTEENTPPTLYNHGFENMDSLGAVYSRASSHIFGDWNAW